MNALYQSSTNYWLRTDHPVSSMNHSMWKHLPALEDALHRGIEAIPDPQRPEFYEVETGGQWFYIHIPSRISGIYLIAAAESGDVDRIRDRRSSVNVTEFPRSPMTV